MEQAIKKAIEGGWKHGIPPAKYTDKYAFWGYPEENSAVNFMLYYSEICDDPFFWESLSKAIGDTKGYDLEPLRHNGSNYISWLAHWHRFIDHLAEGKDADSFFTNLLTQSHGKD